MDISGLTNKAVAEALNKWAEDHIGEVIKRTPYKTGKLRKSIVVERATEDNPELTFISRGAIANDDGVPYNVIQHEVKFKHYTTAGTGPKFMTEPLQKALPDLASKIREALKNGK